MNQNPSDPLTMPPASAIAPVWEDPARPLLERWWATVIGVFTGPTAFFDAMRREGGLGAPLVFAIIGEWIGTIAYRGWLYIGSTLGLFPRAGAGPFAHWMSMSNSFFGTLCWIALAPLLVVIGVFVRAGIVHLCLMLVGGAKRPFETTFRVLTYTSGSIALLLLMPFCGGMVAGVWAIVVAVIGLSRAHQIGTDRAVAAVLIPAGVAMLCGCVGFVLFVLLRQHAPF